MLPPNQLTSLNNIFINNVYHTYIIKVDTLLPQPCAFHFVRILSGVAVLVRGITSCYHFSLCSFRFVHFSVCGPSVCCHDIEMWWLGLDLTIWSNMETKTKWCHLADDTVQCTPLNENIMDWNSMVPVGPIDKRSALVPQTGDESSPNSLVTQI